jgi:hypothetical protein
VYAKVVVSPICSVVFPALTEILVTEIGAVTVKLTLSV